MQKIQITVQAINERCADCPELELDIDRYVMTDFNHSENKNVIRCKYLGRCERLYSQMKADWEENHVHKI